MISPSGCASENVELLVAVDDTGEVVEVVDVAVGAPNVADEPAHDESDVVLGLLNEAHEAPVNGAAPTKPAAKRTPSRGQAGRSRTERGATERSESRQAKSKGSSSEVRTTSGGTPRIPSTPT